jgi:hypothetical protein
LAFLSTLHATSSRAPHLDIDREHVRNGEVLSGIVDRYGSWNVALILVSDAGLVQDISGLLKPSTDAKTFKLGMRHSGNSAGQQPQLLIALTSPSPVNTPPPGTAADAEQFFTHLLEQADKTKTPLAASARYFMLGD